MHGALLVDKPSGPTSHDVVAFVRRLLHTPKVGHTGTLDPLATGLLVLLVGHATRLSQFLVTDDKEYIADVRLGVATPTYDAASLDAAVRSPLSAVRYPPELELKAVLDEFRGTFLQTPPPYSAKKIAGVAAYEKARKNETVELQPVPVTVRELEVLPPAESGERRAESGLRGAASGERPADGEQRSLLRVRIVATSGFYVRSLAHDLGQRLGCGAHLEALRRTRAGQFRVEDSATLDRLNDEGTAAAERLIPLNTLLAGLPAVTLTDEGLRRVSNGNTLAPHHAALGFPAGQAGARVRVLGAAGDVLAVAEQRADGLLHPLLVLR